MKKRQYIILGILILIIGLIASSMMMRGKGGPEKLEDHKKNVKYVKTSIVKTDNYPLTISGSGRVGSSRKLNLIAEVQGKLQPGDVSLKGGSSFRQGQLLYAIDDTEAALKVQARRSGFLTMLASALADLKIDFPEYFPAWETFFQQIEVTKPLPEMPEMTSVKGKTYLASRNILGEYYAIRADEALLRKYKVFAPFDGSFTEVMAEPGTVVNPGTQIARIIQTTNLEVEIAVDAEEAQFLNIGDSVEIGTNNRAQKLNGRILRIGKYVNQNTQSVDVFVGVNDASGTNLYDGMYADVKIRAGRLDDVTRIPRRAIVNKTEVYLVEDTFLIRKPIHIVMKDKQFAYFTGIDSGKVVVIEPVSNPTDSMIVKTLPQDE